VSGGRPHREEGADLEVEVEFDTDPHLRTQARAPRVIVVGGARGGVGKTMLAANLGLYLATIGRRVVLVDADPAGASLHTSLGTRPAPPAQKASRRAARASERVEADAPQATPFQGLRLLHLGLDEPASAAVRAERLQKLGRLREIDADHVVVDLGVGLARELLDAYLDADVAVLITVPEPSAVENTHRFLRGAFVRFAARALRDADAHAELERRVRALGGAPAPLDLLHELQDTGCALAPEVHDAIERFQPNLVVNQTRLRADLELGEALYSVVRRRLGIRLRFLGSIDHDDTVWTCARNRRPLLLEVPGARSSKRIEKIARKLLTYDPAKLPPAEWGLPTDSHHDLFEIARGATDEEIRRAYKRCREIYAQDALCCYGLFEPHEIEKIRVRIDEAFDVLLDPARRRPYELTVFRDAPAPVDDAPEGLPSGPPPPAPEITPDTQFTGALLRQVREFRRVSLRDVSARTKISVPHLRAIEDDDFGKLPAVVYATGFVVELARYLRLDPPQVSRTYVGRYKRYLEDKERGFVTG
jgi:flagellar biosynthesis protein FlhG